MENAFKVGGAGSVAVVAAVVTFSMTFNWGRLPKDAATQQQRQPDTRKKNAAELAKFYSAPHAAPRSNQAPSRTEKRAKFECSWPKALEYLRSSKPTKIKLAAYWIEEQTLDPERQMEVAGLLDQAIRNDPQLAKPLLPALAVWGTPDHVTCISPILEDPQLITEDRLTTLPAVINLIEQHQVKAAIPQLVELLDQADSSASRKILNALEKMGPEAARALVRYMHDGDSSRRQCARRLLEQHQSSVSPSLVFNQCVLDLKSEDDERLYAVLEWLAKEPVSKEYQEQISEALNPLIESDLNVFRLFPAVKKWGTVKNSESVLVALDKITLKSQAYETLGIIQDPATLERLAHGLTISVEAVFAELALKAFGPSAEAAVLPYLLHAELGVRNNACSVLAEIGGAKSLAGLRESVARYGKFSHATAATKAIIARVDESEAKEAETPMETTRIWTDATGKHQVKAIFIEFQNGKVHLKKEDGSIITLSMQQLSSEDQKYTHELLQRNRAAGQSSNQR